jgi:hypothetical protein
MKEKLIRNYFNVLFFYISFYFNGHVASKHVKSSDKQRIVNGFVWLPLFDKTILLCLREYVIELIAKLIHKHIHFVAKLSADFQKIVSARVSLSASHSIS